MKRASFKKNYSHYSDNLVYTFEECLYKRVPYFILLCYLTQRIYEPRSLQTLKSLGKNYYYCLALLHSFASCVVQCTVVDKFQIRLKPASKVAHLNEGFEWILLNIFLFKIGNLIFHDSCHFCPRNVTFRTVAVISLKELTFHWRFQIQFCLTSVIFA